jgi:hypothetical protein
MPLAREKTEWLDVWIPNTNSRGPPRAADRRLHHARLRQPCGDETERQSPRRAAGNQALPQALAAEVAAASAKLLP